MEQKLPERSFFAWLASDPGKAAIAGAAGGLVRWITLRDSWLEGAASIVVGALCAVYLGPFIEPVIYAPFSAVAPEGDVHALAAFVTGLGGIGIAGFVIDLITSRIAKGRRDG